MPRGAPEEADGKVIHGTMTLQPKMVRDYVAAWEGFQMEIDALDEQGKKKKAPKRQAQAKLLKQAAEDGLPKKEFKALLSYRKFRRAADAVETQLDDDQKENFGKMMKAAPWEGTPLAQAAE